MEEKENLYILHLKGTPYEVGYQHGVLMSEEIKKGVARAYADPLTQGRKSYSPLNWIMKRYLDFKIYRPMKKAQSPEILAQLKGIADGSGISYKTIFKANHHTAVSMVMMPIIVNANLKKFKKLGITPGACSTFVATKKATQDGKTIVGRNTDYSGIEGWPKYQTVMFVEPADGFNYVQIGTAGIVLWAPGMNEKQIVVCGHYMIYDDCIPNGWSISGFTDAFLRKAKNLDDAIEILNKNARGVSCGFVITDGKNKDAFAAEVSSGKATIRKMEEDKIIMTNMAISQEKRAIDFVVRYNINEGCPGRYRRIMQLINENYGKITPELAAGFMGDHIRYTTKTERNHYGIVGVDDNVNSIVFNPEDLNLWIAAGPAPVCNNPYIGFDFKKEFSGEEYEIFPRILEGYQFLNDNKRLAMLKFNEAYILHEKDPKLVDQMLEFIKESIDLDPEEIIAYQTAAKLLIHKGNYEEALKFITQALNYPNSLNEDAHNHLLLGIIYDLLGERENALEQYKRVEEIMKIEPEDAWFRANRIVGAYAQKYTKVPFNKKDFGDRCVQVEFSQGSGVE